MRKEQSGISHRDDIRSFVDYIDADEKRVEGVSEKRQTADSDGPQPSGCFTVRTTLV
jgi:hypothetical protein